jgi:hypothetical protein
MTTTREPAPPLDERGAADGTSPTRSGARTWWVIALLVALLAIPLVVALAVLSRPHWYPLLDLAQTEMRVRDVASVHTPLIGLPGRIKGYPNQGSHPGPISFYALWPFYHLFGNGAFGLEAASASLHLVAIAIALLIARRRGGTAFVLGVAAALSLLYASYGGALLTQAWNPFMPVSWWVVFLLAVWSVACDDLAMLPIAVAAGTFCMQTHLPYLGLAGVMLIATFVFIGVSLWRNRDDAAARGKALRWGAASIVLGVVLWLPPIIQQFTHSPGNLSVVVDSLRHPNGAAAGLRQGLHVVLYNLNPFSLISNRGVIPDARQVSGTVVPGALFFLAWLASAVLAWRMRNQSLVRLHAVLAVALVLGAFSIVNITGGVLYYLILWMAGLTVLMGIALVTTVVAWLSNRLAEPARQRAARWGVVGLVTLVVVSTAFFVDDAAYTQVANPAVTRSVAAVIPPTLAALDSGTAPGGGRAGRYYVTWDDQPTIGARGYSLLNELDRHGFHAGADIVNRVGVTTHRVMNPNQATAEVHLVSGDAIDAWARRPGVVRVAYYDPLNAAQRADFNRLQQQVEAELRARGYANIADLVAHDNLIIAALAPGLPRDLALQIQHLSDLGVPVAVFVGPPPHR